MAGSNAGGLLPAADRKIDIERIELDHPRDAAGALGGEDCCAAAAERVEDDPVAPAAVADQIGDEGEALDGGIEVELASPDWVQTVDARIIEHVAAVTPFGAEAEIVDVRRGAVLEDADQLVLAAVKSALAGIGFVPD